MNNQEESNTNNNRKSSVAKGLASQWSTLLSGGTLDEKRDSITIARTSFAKVSGYFLHHPVLTEREKLIIMMLIYHSSVDELESAGATTVRADITMAELGRSLGVDRSQVTRAISNLVSFQIVDKGSVDRERNKGLYLVAKGPWPMLGDTHYSGYSWRGGFLFNVAGRVDRMTSLWRAAVLEGLISDPGEQIRTLFESDGKSVDPSIEDMSYLLNKAKRGNNKRKPRVTRSSVLTEGGISG